MKKTTTARIRELFEKAKGKEFYFRETDPEAEAYFIFMSMENTNAACLARLLELYDQSMRNLLSQVKHTHEGFCPYCALQAEFQKFQRGE